MNKIVRRSFSAVLAAALVFGSICAAPLPAAAWDAGDTVQNVNTDSSHLYSGAPWALGGTRVYFGQFTGKDTDGHGLLTDPASTAGIQDGPVLYRVLGHDGGNLLLDSDRSLFRMNFVDISQNANPEQTTGYINEYSGSFVQKTLNGADFYENGAVFTAVERAAIAQTSLPAAAEYSVSAASTIEGQAIPMIDYAINDHVFVLSAREANTLYANNTARVKTKWNSGSSNVYHWLRTAVLFDTRFSAPYQTTYGIGGTAAILTQSGKISAYVTADYTPGVAPAMNLSVSEICFTSPAGSNKADTLSKTTASTAADWLLTLKGGSGFAAQRVGGGSVEVEGRVTVEVTSLGAPAAGVAYTQLSAMVLNADGTPVAYGKIGGSAVGELDITLPAGLAEGDYTLRVFAEDVNSSATLNLTDYASNSSDIPITVVGYTVTYNVNGGTAGTGPAAQTGLASGSHALLAAPAPSRAATDSASYAFGGWAESAASTVPISSVQIRNADVEVFAIWTERLKTYSLTYAVTGETPDAAAVTGAVPSAAQVAVGADVQKPALSAASTTNAAGQIGTWAFSGWTADPALSAGDRMPASDVIMTGSWTFTPGGFYIPTIYTLTFATNGGSGVSSIQRIEGSVITLDQVTSRKGFTFIGWYADSTLTQKVTSVTLNSNKTVYAKWSAAGRPDMFRSDHVAYIVGYEDGLVHPSASITRAEVATIFFRLLDDATRNANLTAVNSFTDVSPGNWYNTAVSTLAAMGIVEGREDGSFGGGGTITRAEFAAMAARFDSGVYTGADKFTDISGHWAQELINRAADKGWITGYTDGSFKPGQAITRAEAMTLANRVLGRLPETTSDLLTDMRTWGDNADTAAWYYLAVQEATSSHDHAIKADGVHETWTGLLAAPEWEAYEK